MTAISKKIYDPIHGFIKLTEVEMLLVDSMAFKRLHYIRQLGIAYLVYPGATHTRFEHSLGVMHVASQIYDQIISKLDIPLSDEDRAYFRQIVRLSALSHDLGHLPFSHVAEKRLLGVGGHERWTLSVLQSDLLNPLWQAMQTLYPTRDAQKDVIWVSLGRKKLLELEALQEDSTYSAWHHILSEIITGDYFGADRIDYLLRDCRSTGLSYGIFDYHQLMEMLRILPSSDGSIWRLGIEENGIESCEALLLARHFMHKRVYQYGSVKALSFHLSRFMKHIYDTLNPLDSLEGYLRLTDTDILFALQYEARQGQMAHPDAMSILERSARFDYLELPAKVSEQDIKQCLGQEGIPIDKVEWIIAHPQTSESRTFSVLTKTGRVVDAKECSKLLEIPLPVSCIYIPAEYSSSFLKALAALRSSCYERSSVC